jgi:2-keto-4-pentenoate hydratase
VDVLATAALLDTAHRDGACLESSSVEVGDLASAYAVQRELTGLRTARGATRIGWKLGYTSAVMREQMGVAEPNFGPLLSSMALEDGHHAHGFTQPRVEPEIALVIGRTPPTGASTADVLACCSSAHAALEVVDSVWCDYRFDLEHNTADGSSAAGVVLGPELPLDDLDLVGVQLRVDGNATGEGLGADAAGHPAAALAWLVGALAATGESLAPGDIVITGGLTAAVPLDPGGLVLASFTHPSGVTRDVAVRR